MGKGRTGAPLTTEKSPGRRRRDRQQRARQEKRWAAMAGPVKVRELEPRGSIQED